MNPLHVMRLSERCTRLLNYCKTTPVPQNSPTQFVLCVLCCSIQATDYCSGTHSMLIQN